MSRFIAPKTSIGTPSEHQARGCVFFVFVLLLFIHYFIFISRFVTCNFCGKTFSNWQNYTEHLRIHTGERVHCDYCDKHYSQLSGLYSHLRTRHSEQKVKISDKVKRGTRTVGTQTDISHNRYNEHHYNDILPLAQATETGALPDLPPVAWSLD